MFPTWKRALLLQGRKKKRGKRGERKVDMLAVILLTRRNSGEVGKFNFQFYVGD